MKDPHSKLWRSNREALQKSTLTGTNRCGHILSEWRRGKLCCTVRRSAIINQWRLLGKRIVRLHKDAIGSDVRRRIVRVHGLHPKIWKTRISTTRKDIFFYFKLLRNRYSSKKSQQCRLNTRCRQQQQEQLLGKPNAKHILYTIITRTNPNSSSLTTKQSSWNSTPKYSIQEMSKQHKHCRTLVVKKS